MQTETVATSDQAIVKKQRPPVGMFVLAAYLIYSIYTQVSTLQIPYMIIGPFAFTGAVPIIYRLIYALADVLIVYCIFTRRRWTLRFVVPWYGLVFLQALVSFALSVAYRSELPEVYRKVNPIQFGDEFNVLFIVYFSFVFQIAAASLIAWYLYSKRSFFKLEESAEVQSMDFKEFVTVDGALARRAGAALLDYAFFAALIFVGVYVGFISLRGVIFLWILYFPTMEGVFGFTPFKGLLDLKLIPERRNDFRFVVAFKRHLVDPIDFMFFGSIAFLTAKARPDGKRLGDLFAHSHIEWEK